MTPKMITVTLQTVDLLKRWMSSTKIGKLGKGMYLRGKFGVCFSCVGFRVPVEHIGDDYAR